MKEIKISELKPGQLFTANIQTKPVSGKIQIIDGRLYLCQNQMNGKDIETSQRFGYIHSWIVGREGRLTLDSGDLAAFDVSNLVIHPLEPTTKKVSESFISQVRFEDVTNKTYFKGTYNGVEVTGVFYTSRIENTLYILSNNAELRGGNRSPYKYGYTYSHSIIAHGGIIQFPDTLRINFTSKGKSAQVKVIEVEVPAGIITEINPSNIKQGTEVTVTINKKYQIKGVFQKNKGNQLFICYNEGPDYVHSYQRFGKKYSVQLPDANRTTGVIPAKGSFYEVTEIKERDAKLAPHYDHIMSLPEDVGGYQVYMEGDTFVFGCGAVKLTYQQLVDYNKMLRVIKDRIGMDQLEAVNKAAAQLADERTRAAFSSLK